MIPAPQLAGLLALSGAAALLCEVVWLRRLTLAFGSTGVALTLTLAVYMGGLGLGGALGGRARWRGAPAGYGALELAAAGWAAAMPWVLAATLRLADLLPAGEGGAQAGAGLLASALAAVLALGPPAVLHGATLPAAAAGLAPAEGGRGAGLLYAANTAGAVLGVLAAPLLLLPTLGVRGTELAAAGLGATAGLLALAVARAARVPAAASSAGASPALVHAAAAPAAAAPAAAAPAAAALPRPLLLAALVAGFAALALEVAWSRLGVLLLGGSIYAVSTVLAVFLAGTALGAALGRHRGPAVVAPALAALGLLAVLGSLAWRGLPHALGLVWAAGGEAALGPGSALLLVLAMGGAPVASGAVFTGALSAARDAPARAAGQLLAANTVGSVLGSALAGLVLLPGLGVRGTVTAVGLLAALAAALLPAPAAALPSPGARRPLALRLAPAAAVAALALLGPRWDPALYSVGLYLRLADFADLSPRAVERYAHEGFRLLSYEDGVSATVAVGESAATGNRWLAINGKVDASTGEDMPTQVRSGQIPVQAWRARNDGAPRVLVVGLASGVTVAAALEAGAASVDVVELEPAVIRAARAFEAVNGGVLDDPRVRVHAGDARSWLRRSPQRFDVVISEPSNPWITGVSNLFTREYWQLAADRMAPGGVFCQWVQLYALPPDALRGLVRTFTEVHPETWLYETIPGADALLVTAPPAPAAALLPSLDPPGLRRLGRRGRRNTDDQPWIELTAPRWLHRPTGAANARLIEEAGRNAAVLEPPPSPG